MGRMGVPRVRRDWGAVEAGVVAEMRALGLPEAEARVEARRKVERVRLRFCWAQERFDAFYAMQDRVMEICERQIEENPDVDWDEVEPGEFPEPPEEAIAQAIYKEVMEAVEKDRWPRHLHFHWV